METPKCFTDEDWQLWLDAYRRRGYRQQNDPSPNYCMDCCAERRDQLHEQGLCQFPDTEFREVPYTWGGQVETEVRGQRKRQIHSRGKYKIDESDVPLMRALRAAGLTYRTIGQKFDVSADTVRGVCNGRTWRHVPNI